MKKTLFFFQRLFLQQWQFFLFIPAFIVIFYKVFFQKLFPYPGDLLVSWFFPYTTGGWDGYTSWISHKEFIAADVVRQLYPWKTLAIDIFKNWQVPLWNPYNFSGTPLLANLQSAVFYPVNILFFLFQYQIAWNIYILLQPILAYIGIYLFVRSLRLSRYAAAFSGIAFAFMGYFSVWFEWGVIGHTAAWLPFALFGIQKYVAAQQQKYLLITSISLSLSLLAGHAQTAVYVIIIVVSYYVFSCIQKGFGIKKLLFCAWFLILALGLSAIQLLPSLELFSLSARDSFQSLELFHHFQLEWQYLVTLLAPDFFGNPAVGNAWGRDYSEFIVYIGIVPLVFSCIGLKEFFKNQNIRFFSILSLVALLFALPTFFSELLVLFHIPVLSSGSPARALFIVQFGLVMLSGYGVDAVFYKENSKKHIVLLLGCLYLFLWVLILAVISFFHNQALVNHFLIAERNFILPSILFVITAVSIYAVIYKNKLKFIISVFLFFLMSLEYQYFMYKYSPFSPLTYFFPQHILIQFLQNNTPPFRIMGRESTRLEANLSTEWRIFSPEGYDPLYIRRFGEFVYGMGSKTQQDIPRSDVLIENINTKNDNSRQEFLANLLGVKYFVTKNDSLPLDYYQLRWQIRWQKNSWQVYENKKVFPRAAVFYKVAVEKNPTALLSRLLKKDFPYRSILLLEEEPPLFTQISKKESTPVTITNYTPNEVILHVDVQKEGMLFLSDIFYPGWNAFVDGKKTKVYRADYSFRAISVTKGAHTIVFRYQPLSFMLGTMITFLSSASMLVFILHYIKCRVSINITK